MKTSHKVLLLLVTGFAIAGTIYWLQTRGTEKTDDATIEAHIIPVAPKISGYIVELDVSDNQAVHKDDVLLKIDPQDFKLAVAQAEADLASSQAKLDMATHGNESVTVLAAARLTSAEAGVKLAEAEWQNASGTLKRLQSMNDATRSRQSLEDAIAAEKSARSRLEDAQAQLKTAQTAPELVAVSASSVDMLKAGVEKSKASLELARRNLDATVLRAPRDGRITRRTVENGAFVQPGQQLMAVVGNDLWVVANFKETQLTHMKTGQPVDIEVDAYPGVTFRGTVNSFQAGTGARFSLFPPENATGNFVKVVQRVPVKITFDEVPDERYPVGPGMSVVPVVHIQ